MPTLEEITLTPEQEALMVEMIKDVTSAPTDLKALVRYQKWTKKIFLAGVEAGKLQAKAEK